MSVAATLQKDIPDPDTLEAQKKAYQRALDKQFEEGCAQIEAAKNSQKEALRQAAEHQKQQFALGERSKQSAMNLALDEQMNAQILMFQETAMQHQRALEEKAAILNLDYQQKKANEDLLMKQLQIQRQFNDAEQNVQRAFMQKKASLESAAVATAANRPQRFAA